MLFRKLASFTRDYFTLTSRERKGALVLVIVILLQLAGIILFNYLIPPDDTVLTEFRLEMEQFDNRRPSGQPTERRNYQADPPSLPINLKPFDPNTVSDEQWMAWGLTQKQTRVIRNYLNKGGRFRTKEDVSRMYSITPALYERLEPYIRIEQATTRFPGSLRPTDQKINPKPAAIELNGADSVSLARLPLIGPGRARMMVRYRDKLGGFHSPEQLLEVFTIDSAIYQAVIPYLTLDASLIRKFNVNNDTTGHPYLNKSIRKAIAAYRKQHGKYNDINDLRKVSVVNDSLIRKLAPYVSFE